MRFLLLEVVLIMGPPWVGFQMKAKGESFHLSPSLQNSEPSLGSKLQKVNKCKQIAYSKNGWDFWRFFFSKNVPHSQRISLKKEFDILPQKQLIWLRPAKITNLAPKMLSQQRSWVGPKQIWFWSPLTQWIPTRHQTEIKLRVDLYKPAISYWHSQLKKGSPIYGRPQWAFEN